MNQSLLGQPLSQVVESHFFTWFHLSAAEPSASAATATYRPSGERFRDLALVELDLARDSKVRSITLNLQRRFIDSPRENPFARDIAKSLIEAAVPDADRSLMGAFYLALNDPGASGALVIAHPSMPRGGAVAHRNDPAYQVFIGERRGARIEGARYRLSLANVRRGGDAILTMTVGVSESAPDEGVSGGAPENLLQFLSRRARRASDGRLGLDVAIGATATAALLIWRPAGWKALLAAAVVLAAFGAWGMADRELAERSGTDGAAARGLRAVRAFASGMGWVAFIALIFSLIGYALGTWIS